MGLLEIVKQRVLNDNWDIITYFTDYENAFDRVNYELLIKILKKYNINYKDL